MAFMPAPRLVLLDEPCAGVNPSLVDQLRELLVQLNKTQGGSFVVIEHNMDFIMKLCPHVICMVEGKVLAEGAPAACRRTGGARSLSRELTHGRDKIIEFDKVVAGYSPSLTILNETTLDARKGEITLLIGPERRGQVDRAEDAVRHAGAALGRSPLRGQAHQRQDAARAPRRRHRVRAAGAQPVRLAVGAPQPRARRHHAAARRARRRASRKCSTRFPRIRERIDNQASTMSGGEQKQLEVGRALLLRPRVLLIDEPSIGLSPKLVQDVMTLLRELADAGTTVLMVEQNVRTALKYANRALVLEMGRLALDRPAAELLGDPNLNRLFLGGHAPVKASRVTRAASRSPR